jgi:hypothetical protein
MGDFDDLIPNYSKATPAPALDNPFADPFADVGRPRSPDPWSTATSYYQPSFEQQEPQSIFGESPFQREIGEPFGQEHIDHKEALSAHTEPDSAEDTGDPLEAAQASLLDEETREHNELGRKNILGPLPTVKLTPNMSVTAPIDNPVPEESNPATALHQPATIGTSKNTDTLAEDASTHDVKPLPGPLPSVKQVLDPKTEEQPVPASDASIETMIPSVGPSTPSHPENKPSGTEVSAAAVSSSSSSLIQSQPQATVSKFENVVSPLQTPRNHTSSGPLERSFSGLALGGEAPGWAGSTHKSLSPITSLKPTTQEDDDDEEDNRPLATMRSSLDARANVSKGAGSSSTVSTYRSSKPHAVPLTHYLRRQSLLKLHLIVLFFRSQLVIPKKWEIQLALT